MNSAAQALPRSRVSQGCRDAHGDRTYSQHWRMGYSSVEDGDVAGNHSTSSSGGCSYIRGGDSRSRNSLWPPPCRHLHGERVPGILSWIRGKDAARGDTVLSSILPEPVPPSVLWCSVVYRSTLINSFCLGEIHQAFTLCMTHLPVAGGAQLPRIA